MTTLHITVGDRDQLRDDALQFVQAAEADDLADRTGKTVLQFGRYDDLVDTLTPLRLELVRAIAEHSPESMREAARLIDRDVSDVHSDLKQLEADRNPRTRRRWPRRCDPARRPLRPHRDAYRLSARG